jgi:hypothetical protein
MAAHHVWYLTCAASHLQSPHAHTLGKYLIELCLTGADMVKYRPSEWAASALLLARHMLGEGGGWV